MVAEVAAVTSVRWVRRATAPRYGVAHAMLDGALCVRAQAPACEAPWVDVDLSASGEPFGKSCGLCRRRVARRAELGRRADAAVREACAGMDRRALWARALEARR